MKKAHDMNAGLERLIESYKPANRIDTPESFIRLIEAMSDEDAAESKVLRDLYKKINGKQYTKFTPEEQALIDKYGIDAWGFRGDTKLITKGKNDIVKDSDLGRTSWNGKRFIPNENADKINFADRARKTDSRDWGRKYSNVKNAYKQEYERAHQAREMQRPYDEFKSAKSRYNSSKAKLDNYYNDLAKQIERADDKYIQDTNNAILTRHNSLKSSSSNIKNAQTTIDDLLNKHRKAVKEALRQLSLKEAMSDEDRKDSQILRDILFKIDKRSNARLTPEENAILDKYNIQRSTRGLRNSNAAMGLDYSGDVRNINNPEYNLAGKFRTDYRKYANTVKQYKGWHDTFQDAERAKENDDMGKDVSLMKGALDSRKYWVDKKDKAERDYNDAMNTAKADRDKKIAQLTDPERHKGYKDQAEKDKAALNNVRRKYGLPTRESLKRSLKEEERYKRQVIFDACPSGMLDSIIGQMSDGIWENSPGMNPYWAFVDELSPGVLGIDNEWYSEGMKNPYRQMSDDEVRRYYANKAKYIAQLWMNDNNINPYRNWRPDNEEECDYFHDGITVADAYEFFTRNR